jgi:hypothetical protein
MMMPRNIAVAIRAACPRITRPCSASKRRIQTENRQQACQSGEYLAAIFGAMPQEIDPTYPDMISQTTSARMLKNVFRSSLSRPALRKSKNRNTRKCHLCLDLQRSASQTFSMAHTYMLFDFGADEEKAQQARHKLEGWKQALRLDKKLQVKFDRAENAASEPKEVAAEPAKTEKPKSKSKVKTKSSSETAAHNGNIKLLVRLYFSAHEKLSEQRSFDRILADDLFKGATPKVVRETDKEFPDLNKQFDSLE